MASKQKIRLLIVATHPIQYQAPLYRHLAKSEVVDLHVAFLTDFGVKPSFDPGFQRELAFDIPLTDGYEHSFLSTDCTTLPGRFSTQSVRRLISQVRREKCDVVLPPGYGLLITWVICAFGRLRRLPYLMRAETRVETEGSRAVSRRFIKRIALGPLLRGSGACVPIGSSNAEFYRSYGVEEKRMVLAPYSVDNDYFARQGAIGRSRRNEILSSASLDPRLTTVCFAGKLQPHKRPLDLIDAYSRLHATANLIVIGDGPLRDAVARAIADLPNARLLGFVNQSEIGQWFGAIDLLVLPSDSEPWGLVVNESMAAGAVPIVSSEVGCGPDLVQRGGGAVFPVGDCDALARALESFLDDPVALSSARKVTADVIERHSIEETAHGYELAALAASAGAPSLE